MPINHGPNTVHMKGEDGKIRKGLNKGAHDVSLDSTKATNTGTHSDTLSSPFELQERSKARGRATGRCEMEKRD